MMANYGGMQTTQIPRTQPVPQPIVNNQVQNQTQPVTQVQPQPNYSNWFGTPQTQPSQMATEQRGITVCYMVNSREEYGYYSPMAGQTIAIFNFPEHELCLKARDMWGVDLTQRTWDLTETTPSMIPPQVQNQQVQPVTPIQETVSKSEFDEMKAKFDALYKELKG